MNDDLSPSDGPIDPPPTTPPPTSGDPVDAGSIDDRVLSAVLDGEATPAERALVEGSPAGRRRLEQLRAASDAVGAPVVPLAPRTVDALVARALDTASTPVVVETGTASTPEPVTDAVGARRDRRSATARGRVLAGVAAVAAVVVLVAGVAALARAGDGRSSDSASSASSASSAASANSATSATGEAASDGATATEKVPAANDASGRPEIIPPDLGPLGDAETVLDRYTVLAAADPLIDHQFDDSGGAAGAVAAPSAPTFTPSTCQVPPIDTTAGERWSVTADAQLPGGPVLVMSNGSGPGTNRVLVVDAATCVVLAARTI